MYLYILLCLAQWVENTSWKECSTQMFSIWTHTFHVIGPWDKVHCPGGGLALSLKHTLMNFRFETETGCSISDSHMNLGSFPMNVLHSYVISLDSGFFCCLRTQITALAPGLPTLKLRFHRFLHFYKGNIVGGKKRQRSSECSWLCWKTLKNWRTLKRTWAH